MTTDLALVVGLVLIAVWVGYLTKVVADLYQTVEKLASALKRLGEVLVQAHLSDEVDRMLKDLEGDE